MVATYTGDGDTIPEDLAEDYFPPNFKEYMLKEQLKWSRFKGISCSRWVFWSEQDRQIELSLSLDYWADFNSNVCAIPKVEYNIRHALQKLMQQLGHYFNGCLVQFWAATTLEGRTKLTTQYQPFALGMVSWSTIGRQHLCEYRMKMCSSEYNNCFYADANSGEEQLGIPGRVFLHKSPEITPDVKYYSKKEYPQLDDAIQCFIRGSWALPVFEHSSKTCVGVLEIASLYSPALDYYDEPVLHDMHDIFQEFGLQVSNGRLACEEDFREKGKRVKGLAQAFKELNMALRSVCKTHELPLAMTWVPCSACNGLRRRRVSSARGEFCLRRDLDLFYFLEVSKYRHYLREFLEVSKCRHLRKGLVAERARSSLKMLYCSDITQLSLHEYPLVYHARRCNLRGWFTISLQCQHTGNYIYVLEFFLSSKSKADENILTTLCSILGTMEKSFENFRHASGKKLGELMSVDIIYFQNDQKCYSVQEIQATREFSMSSIPSSVQSSASVAYRGPGFQDVNMGTIKAKYDLNSNPFSNFDLSFDSDSDPSFEQSSTSVANTRPGFQNANVVIIVAEYASMEEVFELSLPCRLVELQQEVTRRLMLEVGTYDAIYEDEEDGPVLINCDEDLQTYVDDSMLQGDTPRVVLVEQKEPATNLNPTN